MDGNENISVDTEGIDYFNRLRSIFENRKNDGMETLCANDLLKIMLVPGAFRHHEKTENIEKLDQKKKIKEYLCFTIDKISEQTRDELEMD